MALSKRKEPGGSSSSRPAKRIASSSGAATPVSVQESSDDEYQGSEAGSSPDEEGKYASASETEHINKAKASFSMSNYKRKSARENRAGKSEDTVPIREDRDFSDLPLKPDHAERPLWIDPNKGRILMEKFSPLAAQVQDFLVTIAEPQSRPANIHEYVLSVHSLYAAVSVGLTAPEIINTLDKFSKTPLPSNIKDFIWQSTQSFGKVKLVLKHNQYFVESSDSEVLQKLLRDEVIGPCRIEGSEEITKEAAPTMGGLVIPGTKNAVGAKQPDQEPVATVRTLDDDEDGGINDEDMFAAIRAEDDDDDEVAQVHSFQIPHDKVETVQKRCLELQLPITEEYDFKNDEVNATLDIDLRPAARIRDYQEKSLSLMFGNGRAKSGIIVLPCGAGKTLVGITAACTVRKGVVVLCTSSMSVVQWRNEFLKWSNINPNDIAIFTSDHKDKFSGSTGIIISTYSMVTQTRGRSYDAAKMMDFLQNREWGLMLLDEVHVVPASIFRKVTSAIATHSKLGLTATLLREDDKIKDLNFLIGPKLFEANWMELAEQGHIARVQCAEVWCPMTSEFFSEYIKSTARRKALLYIMNPTKFQACQFLIDYHEKRGDKIIVFSDNVYALQRYAVKLGKAYIYGDTPQPERLSILENFQHNQEVNTLFLSKIGDTSLDLPEATCLIQISSHYGSRRQEAQRLGRILRAKRRGDEGFNAFFYSLVSKDTNEMYYSSKRQAFLVDQGYSFKVITSLQGMEKLPDLAFRTKEERAELLKDVVMQNEMSSNVENVVDDLFSSRSGGGLSSSQKKKLAAKRMAGTLSGLSGADGMAYVEYNKSKNKELKEVAKTAGNKHIQKLRKMNERRRTEK